MEYRRLGASSLKVSVLSLGTWSMDKRPDPKSFDHTFAAMIDAGINFIDTADVYGSGAVEEAIGQRIQYLRRSQILIATKGGAIPRTASTSADLTPRSLRRSLEGSLKRLKVDCIDLYQLHGPDSQNDWDETVGELNRFKDEGKVRYFGYSNFPGPLMALCQYRAFEKNCRSFASRQTFANIAAKDSQCESDHQVSELGLLAYGCLGGGKLASYHTSLTQRMTHYSGMIDLQKVESLRDYATLQDRSALELALGWVVRIGGFCSAIVGMSSPAQIKENALAIQTLLSDDELAAIRAIQERALQSAQVC